MSGVSDPGFGVGIGPNAGLHQPPAFRSEPVLDRNDLDECVSHLFTLGSGAAVSVFHPADPERAQHTLANLHAVSDLSVVLDEGDDRVPGHVSLSMVGRDGVQHQVVLYVSPDVFRAAIVERAR